MKLVKIKALPGVTEQSKQFPQYLAALTACIAGLGSGVHVGWPTSSLPKLLSDEYPFEISNEEASYITLIAPLGSILGGPLTGLLANTIGRKRTILFIALPQIVSFTMFYFSSYSKILLYTGRLAGGMAEGACYTVLPMYLGEVSEPKIRGRIGTWFTLIILTGILHSILVGSFVSLYDAALIGLVYPLALLLTFCWMPESPYYNMMKANSNRAREALVKLRGKANVEEELAKLSHDVGRQISEPATFKDLLCIKSNRNACLISIGLRVIQQFTGICAITLYAQITFKQAIPDMSPTFSSMVFILLQLVVTYLGFFLVDRTGRKPLLIFSSMACALVLGVLGGFYLLREFTQINVSAFKLLPLFMIFAYVVVFAIGLGPVVNIMLGELFSQNVKAKALYLMNANFAIMFLISTKFYQLVSDNFSLAVPLLVFACFCAVGALFIMYFVPETKGKSLEEIQQILKGGDTKLKVTMAQDRKS